MNLLVLVVVGAFAWKLQQLLRQPRDRALQVVVASLGLIMVGDLATQVSGSLPVGVAKLVQNIGLVGSLYLLLCFFVYASREQSPGRGRVPRVRWELVPVAVVVVGMTVSWLLTPAPDRQFSRAPGDITAQSATFYLLTYGYIGYNNLVCIYHALRISRRASRHPAIGLRVAALGLGVGFISAPIGGSAGIVAAVAGATLPAGLLAALPALLLTGIVVYLIGICWPGLVNRGRWIRRMAALWNKYRRLEPLRRLLRPALDLAATCPAGSGERADGPTGGPRCGWNVVTGSSPPAPGCRPRSRPEPRSVSRLPS